MAIFNSKCRADEQLAGGWAMAIISTHASWQDVLIFLCMIRLFLRPSRPLTLRCSANTAKTHKWSLLLQGSCSHHCFFSELWRSRVNRFGPLTISTLPDFCQMGWFTDQGNPFFVEKPEEPRVTFFLFSKKLELKNLRRLWKFVSCDCLS